ncbi:hypothetical protein TNCV_224011 [Trichonephila clavipes]|nr:hypothetical protein TNCV_224011 [Trichonephila clavipes]
MALQTARFRSSPLRGMTSVQGVKSFFTCPCSLLLIFRIAGVFYWNSCLEIKTWCDTLLCGKVKWTWCRLSCSKGIWKNRAVESNNLLPNDPCIRGWDESHGIFFLEDTSPVGKCDLYRRKDKVLTTCVDNE